eukprot:CAMPEP_0171942542 /NCGR_PEP_ID=MMETSP0993-20121228/38761_1 /TAXON_ID=483369 /ORGANISM="non described non described, Strain CCMP2098" /LENGTH=32 /DNA_ID= /DNA_START= /DNA_END= /DNA_ORIENTATION=
MALKETHESTERFTKQQAQNGRKRKRNKKPKT